MSVNQSSIENKAVINGETLQICCVISRPRFNLPRINPLRDAAFDAD